MSGARNHQVRDEERAERRRADREYARQAVERLRSSEGWRRWLATRRHFHAYSFGNQLLIAMARPTATRVAGFRGWLKLGYAVQRGERSIKVWAPCPPSRKQLERWQQDGGDADQRPRTYFRLVPVFDTLSRVCVACQSKNSVGPRDTGIGVRSDRRVTWLNQGMDDAAGLPRSPLPRRPPAAGSAPTAGAPGEAEAHGAMLSGRPVVDKRDARQRQGRHLPSPSRGSPGQPQPACVTPSVRYGHEADVAAAAVLVLAKLRTRASTCD